MDREIDIDFRPQQLKALSSAYGKIEAVLLIHKAAQEGGLPEAVEKHFAPIFKTFADRVTFVILAVHDSFGNHKVAAEYARNFHDAFLDTPLGRKHHYVILACAEPPAGYDDTKQAPDHWAQDPFVVLHNPQGQVVLLEPMFHTHPRNAILAEQLASSANCLIRPTRYFIEGGNILVGDDFALVGCDLLERNRDRYFGHLSHRDGVAEVTAEFKHLLGVRYLHWVGFDAPRVLPLGISQDKSKLQPLFHIDLFITLGGRDRETGKEIVFVAAFELDDVITTPRGETRWHDALRLFQQALKDVAEALRRASLEAAGPEFQVEKMPIGIHVDRQGKAAIYSYNNAHVECFGETKRIYLPLYPTIGLEANQIQKRVERRLDGLGFRFNFVDNYFERYSRYGNGSLHCLSKVLARKSHPSSTIQ